MNQPKNDPLSILAAWTAFEALSPKTYLRPEDLAAGDRRCVTDLSTGEVPWSPEEPAPHQKKLYYQVLLGAIPMGKATGALIAAFGADEEFNERRNEHAAIGALLLDQRGLLVAQHGISISSFAWALPLALNGRLAEFGDWSEIEHKAAEMVEAVVRRQDQDGNEVPLDIATIRAACQALADYFKLPDELIEAPSFALRVYQSSKAKEAPESLLLNSFYLGDLGRARSLVVKGIAPIGLRRLLGMEQPCNLLNLFTDRDALESAAAPVMIPSACWPSPGGYPLVLLQQVAVNLARSELTSKEGTLAVNGPPGTGKTTLLRDIVAACVLDRALALAAFEEPKQAFTAAEIKYAHSSKPFTVHKLAESIKGHEILVASSNNKAVENISRELPASAAISASVEKPCYFKTLSDRLQQGSSAHNSKEFGIAAQSRGETWGLIAAVLGNAKNRAIFQQAFWWDDDCAIRPYLKALQGHSVLREIRDRDSGQLLERRAAAIVSAEAPPSVEAAKANWCKAKERLLTLKAEIDTELADLEQVRKRSVQATRARAELSAQETRLAQLLEEHRALEAQKTQSLSQLCTYAEGLAECVANLNAHRKSGPSLFARILRKERWCAWSRTNQPLLEAKASALAKLAVANKSASKIRAALLKLEREIKKSKQGVAQAAVQADKCEAKVKEQRERLGGRIVDDRLFSLGHEASHLISPWLPDTLQRKREALFMAALALQRAFIDSVPDQLLHNLSVCMDVLAGRAPQDEAARELLPDLWSSLFLVVPVISTSFASVERMFGELAPGSIGWLLIDETGQAPPQAAVGAIMRAKRSIVVGDPLQIPPIVTVPERLCASICEHFSIDQLRWAAPQASAQTLVDAASRYQAAFNSDRGPRHVGVPLLVHRRCQEPIFGISNRMAYDGQMVYGTAPYSDASGSIRSVLGPSRWLNIDGEASSKWCPAEGELVISLLTELARAGIAKPDLFIITPFRIVAFELRRRLEGERELLKALGLDSTAWPADRVGTIHTVQGREADSVILVLGAPNNLQNGARAWAAGTPNVLNVAVSRAKRNLYVVGSYASWERVGYARELAALPQIRVDLCCH